MRAATERGLLVVEYDEAILSAVEKALGDLKGQRFKVLKAAVNATAKQAQNALVGKAQETYTAKKGPLKRAVKIKQKATDSRPEATIDVAGTAQELRTFKTKASKGGVQAKVLSSSAFKAIQSQRGSRAKAFLATFESGKTAIVQRQDGQEYTRGRSQRIEKYGPKTDLTRIKMLLSVSAPQMVGGEKVLGELAPDIYDNLMENISREIERVLKR